MSENASPEQIEREIDATRNHLGATLDALQQKLTPSVLLDQAWKSSGAGDTWNAVTDGSSRFVGNLGNAIAAHPVPALMAGVGIAWLALAPSRSHNGSGARRARSYSLEPDAQPTETAALGAGLSDAGTAPLGMASSDRPGSRMDPARGDSLRDDAVSASGDAVVAVGEARSSRAETLLSRPAPEDWRAGHSDPDESSRGTDESASGIRERAGRLREAAKQGVEQVKSAISAKTERAAEGMDKMKSAFKDRSDAIKDSGSQVRERARHATGFVRTVPARVGGAARSTSDFVRENPILVGALAMAVGATVALMLPTSRRERELLGDASDQVRSRVKDVVHEKMEKAASVARTAAEAAVDAARKEASGDGGESGTGAPADPAMPPRGAGETPPRGAGETPRPSPVADIPASVRDSGARPGSAARPTVGVGVGDVPSQVGESAVLRDEVRR